MFILLVEYIKKLLRAIKMFVLLTDKTADEIITVIFGYLLPIMLAVLLISMTCYCVHRYIHVSKQKHPTNLVSILCCRRMLPTLAREVHFPGGSHGYPHTKSSGCCSDQEKNIT